MQPGSFLGSLGTTMGKGWDAGLNTALSKWVGRKPNRLDPRPSDWITFISLLKDTEGNSRNIYDE